MCSGGVVQQIAGQENNSMSQFKHGSIFRCFQFRVLCLLRYKIRAPHMMASGYDCKRRHTRRGSTHDTITSNKATNLFYIKWPSIIDSLKIYVKGAAGIANQLATTQTPYL
jgi:hypothetical protein